MFQPTDRRKAKSRGLKSAYIEKKELDVQNENFNVIFAPPLERWNGTSINLELINWEDNTKSTIYNYTKTGGERWKPETRQRPCKHIYYIGLDSCVPISEQDNNRKSRTRRMKQYAHILNKNQEIAETLSSILGKTFKDVEKTEEDAEHNPQNIAINKSGQIYSMIDLSAGEQRLLRMLQILYRAKTYSIFLIDEIELTLHPIALDKLLTKIVQLAESKHLQVIFTSHREQILKRNDINIRSLYVYNNKIICENGIVPQCLEQILGREYPKDKTIFCEDKLSKYLIEKILTQLGKRKYFNVIPFGSYSKGFMVATSLQTVDKLTDPMLFVLDGDVCMTIEEKRSEANKWHTSDDKDTAERINDVVSHFTQFELPNETKLERYIYDILVADASDDPINIAARNVSPEPVIPIDLIDKEQIKYFKKHYFIDEMVKELGYDEDEALRDIVARLSTYTDTWNNFIANVKERIEKL